MSFTSRFTAGFYQSSSRTASGKVPSAFPVSLDGTPYMVDTSIEWGWQTIPMLRPYFLSKNDLGEEQLNPDALWRKSFTTWYKGAGQTHYDWPDSDSARFRSSKGVDPWTRNRLALLPDTDQVLGSASSNLATVVCGSRLYVADGNALKYTTDLAAFTTVTGTPAAAVTGLCSDGFTTYAAYASNGLWSLGRTDTAATQYVTDAVTFNTIGYVKGRLMVAEGGALYNVVASGALPAALWTHPNADWTWVGFADGQDYIYAAGFSGSVSEIYRVGIKSDGTGLDVPIIAGTLTAGEVVRSIYAYQGFMLIGTDQGVRFAVASATSGNLEIGALIETAACRCFTGWGQFLWFGWDDYDTASTGLGRLNLSVINDTAPAYASDLMAAGQGNVTSVTTFNAKRVFTVAGLGVYSESANLVASGTLDSGLFTYNIPDPKVALYVDVTHDMPMTGSHSVSLAVDNGSMVSLGTHTSTSTEGVFSCAQRSGETFEIRSTLSRDGSDLTAGPAITRTTMFAQAAAKPSAFITVPLLLAERVRDLNGVAHNFDIDARRQVVEALYTSKRSVTYQEGGRTLTVSVDDLQWVPKEFNRRSQAFEGVLLTKLKVQL